MRFFFNDPNIEIFAVKKCVTRDDCGLMECISLREIQLAFLDAQILFLYFYYTFTRFRVLHGGRV